MNDKITSSYIHSLQYHYCNIGDRGIRVDLHKRAENRKIISENITKQLEIASKQWGCKVFIGRDNDPGKDDKTAVNINSAQGERALLKKLKDLGYHVPQITRKNEEGEYESRFSAGELALQKMLTESLSKHPAGDPAIRAILQVREYGKLQNGYFNTRLLRRTDEKGNAYFLFLSNYNAAGTVTGRRNSKRHTFGFGNNAQNFPSHSKSASLFREVLIPREGNIFLFVDQIQAEEWPVSALSMNYSALEELESQKDPDPEKRIDRHSKLASAIFDEYIPPKASKDWNKEKHDMKRYLGKKIKHARNYGMKKKRMSESLAQEGFAVTENYCGVLLDLAARIDPSVDTVFHTYIKKEVSDNHFLSNPFGRERQFLGARPNADNSSLFNEAYSWIPQSTVGDNTGFAVYYIEEFFPEAQSIVQEGHDSIVQDIPANVESIQRAFERTQKAFDRKIRFHNGIELYIPIEAEIGFSFKDTVKLETFTKSEIENAINELNKKRLKDENTKKEETRV